MKYNARQYKKALIQLASAVFDNVNYPENGLVDKALIKAHPFITETTICSKHKIYDKDCELCNANAKSYSQKAIEIMHNHIDPHCFIKDKCYETVLDAMQEYAKHCLDEQANEVIFAGEKVTIIGSTPDKTI